MDFFPNIASASFTSNSEVLTNSFDLYPLNAYPIPTYIKMAMFLVRYPQPESTHFVHPHAGHHHRLQHHGRCGGRGRATTRPFAGHCSANGAHRHSPVNIKEDEINK